jgi:hypothetical protein
MDRVGNVDITTIVVAKVGLQHCSFVNLLLENHWIFCSEALSQWAHVLEIGFICSHIIR